MSNMRPSERDARRTTPSSDVLRSTHPFRLLMRRGEVVGLWYASFTRPGRAAPGDASGPCLTTNYRGMVRTTDGRVAGVCGNMALTSDLADTMHRMLTEASQATFATSAATAAGAFVDGLREVLALYQGEWTARRETMGLRTAAWLDGVHGWRHDDDLSETVVALKALHAARGRMVDRFLATLDLALVNALSAASLSLDDLAHMRRLGQAWPLLDETFGQGAPLKDRVVPVIGDSRSVENILRGHLPSPPPGAQVIKEWDLLDQRDRMRQFLPEVRSDLVEVAAPGFN